MAIKRQTLRPILSYPNRVTEGLRQQIDRQLALSRLIKAVLPHELADNVEHCTLNGTKLVVYTNSANWASQLRFYTETMLAAITTANPARIAHVAQIKVVEDLTTPKKIASQSLKIPSKSVRNQILNLSAVTTDPKLKETLSKLHATLDRLANQ